MQLAQRGRVFWLLTILVAAAIGGCRRAIVIVPSPDRTYTQRDTLYGFRNGNRVTVSFRIDTVMRVDTVALVDTLWRDGTRTIVRVDTLRRVDTVRVASPTTTGGTVTPPVPIPTRIPDRPRVPSPGTPTTDRPTTDRPTTDRPTTTRPTGGTTGRVDTVVVTRRDTVVVVRRDTIRDTVVVVRGGTGRDTVVVARTDTIRDTVIVARADTIRDTVVVARTDTIRVVGRRTLFVPPGHYPPEGQCRIWIYDVPPGRQADPTSCASLGSIPAGAFILFGGDAWDADYDWVAEAQRAAVPPEIIAMSRRRRP